MAGLDDIAKAFVAAQSGADELIAAENPYLRFKAVPDRLQDLTLQAAGTGKFKMKDLIASALISGLGSGIADSFAQDYAGRAQDAAFGAIEGGLSGESIDRPDVLSPGLFKKLDNQGRLFRLQTQLGQVQRAQDLKNEIAAEGAKAAQKILGENAAWEQLNADVQAPTVQGAAQGGEVEPGAAAVVMEGLDPLDAELARMNPNNPRYKVLAAERTRLDQMFNDVQQSLEKGPAASDYRARRESLQSLLANLNNNDTAADLAIIAGFQRTIDPGVSVRGEDVSTIREGQAYLTKLFGDISGWFTSDNRLKPEFREKLAAAAINTANASGSEFEGFAQQRLAQLPESRRKKVAYIKHEPFNLENYVKQQEAAIRGAVPQYSMQDLQAAGYSESDIAALRQQGVVR